MLLPSVSALTHNDRRPSPPLPCARGLCPMDIARQSQPRLTALHVGCYLQMVVTYGLCTASPTPLATNPRQKFHSFVVVVVIS